MITIHAPGDGFCFFHCVSMFLRKSSEPDEAHMSFVRDAILTWLWDHRKDDGVCQTLRVAAKEEGQPTIRKYLQRVQQRGFGGSEMHLGASQVFGMNIVTYMSPRVSFMSASAPSAPKKRPKTMRLHYDSVHYNLVMSNARPPRKRASQARTRAS